MSFLIENLLKPEGVEEGEQKLMMRIKEEEIEEEEEEEHGGEVIRRDMEGREGESFDDHDINNNNHENHNSNRNSNHNNNHNNHSDHSNYSNHSNLDDNHDENNHEDIERVAAEEGLVVIDTREEMQHHEHHSPPPYLRDLGMSERSMGMSERSMGRSERGMVMSPRGLEDRRYSDHRMVDERSERRRRADHGGDMGDHHVMEHRHGMVVVERNDPRVMRYSPLPSRPSQGIWNVYLFSAFDSYNPGGGNFSRMWLILFYKKLFIRNLYPSLKKLLKK